MSSICAFLTPQAVLLRQKHGSTAAFERHCYISPSLDISSNTCLTQAESQSVVLFTVTSEKLSHCSFPNPHSPLLLSLSLVFLSLSSFSFFVSPSQVVSESGSLNGKGREQMDDTHMAAEEDEGEEGHIPHTQSSPNMHSLTHNLAPEQHGRPALIKKEPELDLTNFALNHNVCSLVSLRNGYAENLSKPNGANITTGSHCHPNPTSEKTVTASGPQRSLITASPKECSEKRPLTPPEKPLLPLKKIKLKDPWVWIPDQNPTMPSDGDEVCEDPLSTLAAVVCLSVTERKGLEEKLLCSRSSILRCIKTEPPDLHFIKKEPKDFQDDLCQKSTTVITPLPVKSESPRDLLPSVQSLAEKRNLSFDQAIAIEALTQLAIPENSSVKSIKVERKCDYPISTVSPFLHNNKSSAIQDVKPISNVHCNKVSVISSALHQTSVIRPPVARQGNVIQCSRGMNPNTKQSLHDLLEASDKTSCWGKGSITIKTEPGYKNHNDVKFEKDFEESDGAGKVRRNRDEEEVAAQLADLAFIIQSRNSQQSENNPPKGTPVPAIKYNYSFQQQASQKKSLTKTKTKATPTKPRKKKGDVQQGRTPNSKHIPNGEIPHRRRGQKNLPTARSGLPQRRNLFLPQAQIDLKKYSAEAQEKKRQINHHSNLHSIEIGAQIQNHSTLTRFTLTPWSLSNGSLHQHSPCKNLTVATEHKSDRLLLSQVAQPGGGLQHDADSTSSPVSTTNGPSGLVNGFSRTAESPPPCQQNYYKVERSGPVTVLSTATDGGLMHSAESTPSKNSVNSFLESPGSFLDTPTKNLLNTPSTKLSDLPSCQCVGKFKSGEPA